MHQFVSAVLSFLLSPVNLIILLLIAGYLFRPVSIKRSCRIGALVLFLLFSNQWLLDLYASKWQPPPALINPGTMYSCGIVPGGFASPDASGNGYFNASADRFIQALKLYKLGQITHILVSGGNGKAELKTFREAEWVKKELAILGVPDSVIYIEDNSGNTAENARNTKKILDENHLQRPYLLISSAHHLPRAMAIFKNAGLITVAFPCNYLAGRGINTISSIIPRLEVLFAWNPYLKETAGYLWYR
jgi:uncharacterized SAM-binding protein YcdF (DUF218 family)